MENDEHDTPVRLRLGGTWEEITRVQQHWRVDQHWWRGEPIRRDYYQVVLEDKAPTTIYHDLMGGNWFRQAYG